MTSGFDFDFTSDFQDLLLACILRHPDKFMAHSLMLEPRQFTGVQATIISRCALQHFQERGRFPTWEALTQISLDELEKLSQGRAEEETEEHMLDYLQKLREIDTGDVDMVQERTIKFVRERTALAIIRESIQDIQSGKLNDGEIAGKVIGGFEDMLKIGTNLDDLGYILHRDAQAVIDKITNRDYGVRTGYERFDTIWKTGWCPGWLCVILAPPKRFKTAMCLNLALNMIGPSIMENVIYYTCEISQELALARALTRLAGKSFDYLYAHPEKFAVAAQEQINMSVSANLVIKGFPAKSVRIVDLSAHTQTIVRQLDIVPKAIIIDFAETILPSDRTMSEPQQQASIYTDARALGHKFNCPVILPDRCNRETVSLAVPNMTSFQGSFQKGGIVDLAIGQCATDAEYKNNIMRWFVFINRHGKAYQHFRGKVDPDIMRIEIDTEIDYNPDEEAEKKKKRSRGRHDELPQDLQE